MEFFKNNTINLYINDFDFKINCNEEIKFYDKNKSLIFSINKFNIIEIINDLIYINNINNKDSDYIFIIVDFNNYKSSIDFIILLFKNEIRTFVTKYVKKLDKQIKYCKSISTFKDEENNNIINRNYYNLINNNYRFNIEIDYNKKIIFTSA